MDRLRRLTPWQATLLLVAASTLLRIVLAASANLSTDEAHYALYGLHLDWSYFDHPPLVGWLQALILPFSSSDLAMRLMPILLFSAAALVLHRLTVTLFPQESPWLGFSAVLLLHSGLMFLLLGLALVPDTPLLLLGLLATLAVHGVVQQGRTRDWLLLGLLLGLAGLAKYTAVTLVLTVLIALGLRWQWRQLLRPGPWLAMLLAALLILPVLYWNATHDWISFLYQLKHGTGNPEWKPGRWLLAQLAQLLAYGPVLYLLGLAALFAALRDWREPGVQLVLALVLPILLLFGWNAGYEMTLPHWTALAWAGLAPLLARWLWQGWQARRGLRLAVRLGAAYTLVLLALLLSELLHPWLPFADDRDPLRDLYGWPEAARRAQSLRTDMAATSGPAPQLFAGHWTYASRLAWYARPQPVQVTDQRFDQFDLWFGAPERGARGILLLWPDADASPATGGPGQFGSCELLRREPYLVNAHRVATFSYFACQGFQPARTGL